jgi:hypothetical protein
MHMIVYSDATYTRLRGPENAVIVSSCKAQVIYKTVIDCTGTLVTCGDNSLAQSR